MYLCITEKSVHTVSGFTSTHSVSVDYTDSAVCCGRRVAATEGAVQSLMTTLGLTPGEQAVEWLRVGRSRPEPEWLECCLAAARRMAAVVEGEREVLEAVGGSVDLATGVSAPRQPVGELAERHFEWLGESRGITVDVLRDGIAALARQGYISPDASQQAALRRGLGVSLNAAERSSRAPWVRWLGESDALNYLVDSLWRMQLIHCPGGQRYKWQTLCGVFLHASGARYEPSIKSNRCGNAAKRATIDAALLDGLRFAFR